MLEASAKTSGMTLWPNRANNIAQLFLHAEVDRQAARNPWSPYRILPHGMVWWLDSDARTQSPGGFAGNAAAIITRAVTIVVGAHQ